MFDWIKDWWWEVKWWWGQTRVAGWFEHWAENLGYFCFIVIACCAGIMVSPLLAIFGVFWAIYYLVTNGKAICVGIYEWIRDKIAITLVCTLAGLLLGICGGATGAAGGAALGFFLGVILELVRWTDTNQTYGTKTYKQGNWLGLPYDDGVYESPQQQQVSSLYTGKVRYYEKPWTWKGFQVDKGPKEDTLRRDV